MQAPEELEELRVSLERIRTLLENVVVRGLRACGSDELAQLASYSEHLEQTGAGHLASMLSELRNQIERDDRASAHQLLLAQINVRLLERLLTLRVVKGHYANAIEAAEQFASSVDAAADVDEDDDEAIEE
jgi:ATP-dependent protease HslVU (ClpYQ) peptidase subunit